MAAGAGRMALFPYAFAHRGPATLGAACPCQASIHGQRPAGSDLRVDAGGADPGGRAALACFRAPRARVVKNVEHATDSRVELVY